ncbi:VWA domain-containing protein [Christiangramia sp. SM2212]|uniref:VWA domain-containing protein n=1 Tax=Christiangramia sediminicola TaxID=3073267 RepID=A0ABU1EPR8_9FLAO|nr:VWA domain-containing protein [Christiangramia sp. SM2212]MDR5590381.1 VWA domain-containing protein [Christiangramia sp. SM2212]
MTITTIIYITLALLIALGFAFFQYLLGKKIRSGKDYIFFALRAVATFIILLLFINPRITSTEYEIVKPELIILSDNSESVTHLNANQEIFNISEELISNKEIESGFQINQLKFGEQLSVSDSLNFKDSQTDIYSGLSSAEDLFSGKQTALILLSDGNQSLGRDYRYFSQNSNTTIFPLIIGDTTNYKDLSISRINSNRYAFLNNRFPVEAFINYSGDKNVEATVRIRSGKLVLYSEQINFSKSQNSLILRTDLPANTLGIKSYTIEIDSLEREKNTINNKQNFAVEVIDERTNVLILTDISHPDLGAFQKSIQSNQQRKVDIKFLNNENIQLNDYQLIILFQVNRKFKKYVDEILKEKYNFLLVSGNKTDWNYLNELGLGLNRNAVNQPQEYFSNYNKNFSAFQFEDLGFDDLPPLVDKFGPLEFDANKFNPLLFQEIEGVNTEDPLIAVSKDERKFGFILGENIWRWRAKSFLDNQSFEHFDDFFGKLIQNLAKNTSKQRLTVDSDNFYYANQNVIISAQYFDENYQFDGSANLKISVENEESEESFTSDLVLRNNFYQFDGGDLAPGDYSYYVSVQGSKLNRTGKFKVIDYNTEQQFVSANLNGMQALADNNQTELYYQDQVDKLIQNLLANDKFKPVQKSHQKNVPLIDWYYLLFILIIVLAVEWFYRKYLGLI